jgi:hypothetical protein
LKKSTQTGKFNGGRRRRPDGDGIERARRMIPGKLGVARKTQATFGRWRKTCRLKQRARTRAIFKNEVTLMATKKLKKGKKLEETKPLRRK